MKTHRLRTHGLVRREGRTMGWVLCGKDGRQIIPLTAGDGEPTQKHYDWAAQLWAQYLAN